MVAMVFRRRNDLAAAKQSSPLPAPAHRQDALQENTRQDSSARPLQVFPPARSTQTAATSSGSLPRSPPSQSPPTPPTPLPAPAAAIRAFAARPAPSARGCRAPGTARTTRRKPKRQALYCAPYRWAKVPPQRQTIPPPCQQLERSQTHANRKTRYSRADSDRRLPPAPESSPAVHRSRAAP